MNMIGYKKKLLIVFLFLVIPITIYCIYLYPFTEEHDKRVVEKFYKKNENLFLEVQECILNIPEGEKDYSYIYIYCNNRNISYEVRDYSEIILSGSLKKKEENCVLGLCSQIQDETKGKITMISYSVKENCIKYIFEYGGILSISVGDNQFSFEGVLDD